MKHEKRLGLLIAAVLAGSWRSSNYRPLEVTEAELEEVTPLLCVSGAAALSWRRISSSHLKDTAAAEVLHQTYRLQSLKSAMHEEQVAQLFRVMRQASVEVILAKGWAASRFYEQEDLRPSGDIDIWVRPEHHKIAQDVLRSPEGSGFFVDLHKEFSELGKRTFDEVFARAESVAVNGEHVRVLGKEDHLALLCIHLLKHSGWRPLWLCDVSAAIESLPPSFDWNLCLGNDRTRARWITSVIFLAHRLLATDVSKCPVPENAELPSWLVDNVLKNWSAPSPMNYPPMSHPIPMSTLLRHPGKLMEGLRQRWPNPITATISVNGELNDFPRFPYQVANCVFRVKRLVTYWPGEWLEQ